MKKVILFIPLLCLLFVSCDSVKGEGPSVTEERELTNFDKIEVNSFADIFYEQSDEFSVVIETQANLMEYIETKIEGTTLVIEQRNNTSLQSDGGINIYISCPNMSDMTINGSGSITGQNKIVTSDLSCTINGSGDFYFKNIIATHYWMNINGSGDLEIDSGKIKNGEYGINGSGDIHVSSVKTDNIEISINGSGDAEVFAIKELDISIIGSGGVQYKGYPNLTIDITGSGDVEQM